MSTFDRRAFLKKIGLATSTAVIAAPAVASVIEPDLVEAAPSRPMPREPIVAIVRDAERGEVTVLSSTTEKTYRDAALVRRLLRAAGQQRSVWKGGA
jgi:hypothetical protein